MTYKCVICNKEVKLLKKHLLNSHSHLNCDEYFKLYPNEFKIHEDFKKDIKYIRQKGSPNSIHFYLSRGCDQAEAEEKLKIHRSKSPLLRDDTSPNNIKFWMKKGYTEEESIEKVRLNQSRSLESYVTKYGEEKGTKMKENLNIKYKQRKDVQISNYMIKYDLNTKQATDLYKYQKKLNMPNFIEYWLYRGFNENEGYQFIQQIRDKYLSPRSIKYWINKGYDNNLSKDMLRKFQGRNSIEAIMDKNKCSKEEAIIIQDNIINKMLTSKMEKGSIISYDEVKNYFDYRLKVDKLTKKTYRLYKHIIDPNNLRSPEFHIDHKYSIFRGFLNKVDCEIISSVHNLELLPRVKNSQKGSKCSITLEELINKINNNK